MNELCKHSSKQLGLIFRKFYIRHSSSSTLMRLYVSCVRSRLEYACPAWDPHFVTLISALENTQKYVLRIFTKNWSGDYSSLLECTDLPKLSVRRCYLKLCLFYQVKNGTFTFPNVPLRRHYILPCLRSFESIQFECPVVHTDAFKFSYFPHAISLWNSLPVDIQCCPSLYSFKRNVVSIFV